MTSTQLSPASQALPQQRGPGVTPPTVPVALVPVDLTPVPQRPARRDVIAIKASLAAVRREPVALPSRSTRTSSRWLRAARTMFASDMTAQMQRMTDVLLSTLSGLEHETPALEAKLRALGVLHRDRWQVQPAHYLYIAHALTRAVLMILARLVGLAQLELDRADPVDHLDVPVRGDEQVVGLHVPVGEPQPPRRRQGVQRLQGDPNGQPGRQPPAVARPAGAPASGCPRTRSPGGASRGRRGSPTAGRRSRGSAGTESGTRSRRWAARTGRSPRRRGAGTLTATGIRRSHSSPR